ncbi:hypothetical protein BTJ45_03776 [Bacillus mycoides]|nr:hypothetical protein BTJ45_03776 [Bacillus mycoides]
MRGGWSFRRRGAFCLVGRCEATGDSSRWSWITTKSASGSFRMRGGWSFRRRGAFCLAGRREATDHSSRWSWIISKSATDCSGPVAKVLPHRRCFLSSCRKGS